MEHELPLHEEHRTNGSHRDVDLHGVEIKDYNKDLFLDLCVILWEYWSRVNMTDLSVVKEHEFFDLKFPMTGVEARVYQLMAEKRQFKLAYVGSEVVGLLVYNFIHGCLLSVECLYVRPEYEQNGIGKKLINSVGKVVKILFQTRTDNAPDRLLELVKNYDPVELNSESYKKTWELKWYCH